jgi:uncharacterized membrane protein YuzA (DUF378 family)
MSWSEKSPGTMIYMKYLHMLVIFLVLVGGVNWLSIGTTGQDLVRMALPPRHAKWVYIAVGLAAFSLLFSKDMYLPFLGETVLPGGSLQQKTPQSANDQVSIKTTPNAKVVYWATEPNPTQGKTLPSWEEAYDEYENSGVAVADGQGNAILRFRGTPQPYTVPIHGRLEPHIHFRVSGKNGMMGPVQTVFLSSGNIEGFSNIL